MGTYSNFGTRNLRIETMLSVSPWKFSETRQVRQVSTGSGVDPFGSGLLGGCLNLLLYYNKASADDSGWLHAGWIRESLGRALLEQPIFSGRLRRRHTTTTNHHPHDDDHKRLEIVSNDSGVRLVEARMPVTLSEFLGSKSLQEAESELVFWKDIDGDDPRFCPLFYLQVTNFECGGYSFGISCSLLLADLLFKENFLKRWAEIHNNIMFGSSKNDVVRPPQSLPLFYLPNFKGDYGRSTDPSVLTSSPSKKSGPTMIFNVNNKKIINTNYALDQIVSTTNINNTNLEKELITSYYSSLALLCVEKADNQAELIGDHNIIGHKKKGSEYFSLFVNEAENVKVAKFSKSGIVKPKNFSFDNMNNNYGITSSSLDELGANEVEFRQGNRPIRASYWIGSILGEVVVAIPSSDEDGSKIIVTVPDEKQN